MFASERMHPILAATGAAPAAFVRFRFTLYVELVRLTVRVLRQCSAERDGRA